MHPLLLMVVLFGFVWYYWHTYSPYFSFPSCSLFDWKLVLMIFRRKDSRKTPIHLHLLKKIRGDFRKYMSEGMFILWFVKPVLFVYGPECVKFFSNEPSLSDKPRWIYKFFDSLSESGLFISNGKRMKKQRKLASPAFYQSMMKNYSTIMIDHAEQLVQELSQLENNTTGDLENIITIRSLKLFFESSLGLKADSPEKARTINDFLEPTMKGMDFMAYRMLRPWLHMNFMLPFFSAGRKHIETVKEVQRLTKQVIEDLKKSYSLRDQSMSCANTDPHLSEQRFKSFGDVLIEEHLKDPSFTLEDVRSDVLTLIVAGYDTVSHTLTWCLWLLGLHQDIQEKAYEEIKSVTDKVIQYEDVRKLAYLECIVKETLRMYPSVPVYARCSNKNLQFGNHTIPRGTTVAFLPYVLHKNPDVYPEPESFNPDRFAENSSNVNPWAFIPFAEGARSCIGKKYAMLEMKTLLAEVIRNFKIVSLTQRKDVRTSWEAILKSATPISVKFIPR